MKKESNRRICNCCGKTLNTEEYVRIEQKWGYFSKKDGTLQCGNICEDCFEKLTRQFLIPLEEKEVTELL